ncbi:patatin-like phospholipase family protein [Pelosinus propionicus]|uniref:NTE family protein n=1 Tax=Pelosinus propionicus DSM 13327 TaxID=1123291 RepID=A0A1I4L9L6_9FIRM|nr:patatin-like phospholipase family protein [Pelosinus propionicus]SFL87702.1 NTE family protein [Pelosinus propionicus DSM 13327]
MRPKIGVVLGSGGLRGLAHIGVLKILEREKIPIDYIAGCSIGSLIGALYCSGHTPEIILQLAKHLKPRHWMDFMISKMGIVSGDKVLEIIHLLTKGKNFSDLRIPLAIVATDIKQGKEIIFTEGNVAVAVRASTSVPGFFVPFILGDMLLVDGAVLNPTPIDIVRKMGADIVIAVDLAHAGTICNITNILDVIIQSIDIMERELFKYRQHNWDILIRPDVAHIQPSSFEYMDESVLLGEQAAEKMILDIKHLLNHSMLEYKELDNENPMHPYSN